MTKYRSKYRLIVEHLDAEMKWGNPRIKHPFGYSIVSLKLYVYVTVNIQKSWKSNISFTYCLDTIHMYVILHEMTYM